MTVVVPALRTFRNKTESLTAPVLVRGAVAVLKVRNAIPKTKERTGSKKFV